MGSPGNFERSQDHDPRSLLYIDIPSVVIEAIVGIAIGIAYRAQA